MSKEITRQAVESYACLFERCQKRYGENDDDDYHIKITVKNELSTAKTSQAKLGWTEVAGRRSDLQ